MGKMYIAIDPGSKGFVAAFEDGKWVHIPLDGCDFAELSDIFAGWRSSHNDMVCAIEDVHALYNSSAESTFNFGFICGMLRMLLIANRIPYELVQPKTWQKEVWNNADIVSHKETITKKDGSTMVRNVIDTKQTSMNAAKRLLPTLDFRKTQKCKKMDDNKVDASLLNIYAQRKNL